jgi:hypothetical protein
MPKRSSRGKQGPEGIDEIAFRVAREAVGENPKDWQDGKNPAAVVLGRLGGLKGGKARAEKLSPEERSRIARLAACSRWEGRKNA